MKFKEQNITKAGAMLLLSAVIVKIIGALFKIPLSADYALGDLGFGYFSSCYDLYIPIYTLALSGFPVAIAKMIADYTAQDDTEKVRSIFAVSFKTLLSGSVIIALFIALISLPMIILGSKDGNIGYSLLATAPSVVCCAMSSVYRGYFEGHKNMTATAVSNIIEALGKLILGLSGGIIVIRITGNASLAAAATMLGITVGTLFSCIYLRFCFDKSNNIQPPINFREKVKDNAVLKELTLLLIPIAVASLSVGFTSFVDSVTLKPQLSAILKADPQNSRVLLWGTYYENVPLNKIPTLLYGIKSKTHTLFNLVPTLTVALGMGAIPLVTENFVKNNRTELKNNVDTVLKISSILVMPISAGFISMGEGIMELLYGNMSSVLGGKLLMIYGIAALFAGLAVPTTSLLQAGDRQKTALYNIGFGILAKIICNVLLSGIVKINVFGAAIGTAVCFILIFILNMVCIVKIYGFLPDIKTCFVKPLMASSICSVVAFICEKTFDFRFSQVISIALGGVTYLTVLAILKTISVKELKDIVK